MPRLFCARDRKRGSKLDAARFIRFEDYVHALVARRCGELLHGWRVRKQYRFLRGRKQLERVLKRETSSDLRIVVRIRKKLSEIEFFLEIIRNTFAIHSSTRLLDFFRSPNIPRFGSVLLKRQSKFSQVWSGWNSVERILGKKILETKEGNFGFIWEPWTRLSNG